MYPVTDYSLFPVSEVLYSTRHKNCITHVETGVFLFAALQEEIDIVTWNFHNLSFIILPDEKNNISIIAAT